MSSITSQQLCNLMVLAKMMVLIAVNRQHADTISTCIPTDLLLKFDFMGETVLESNSL